MKNTKKIFLSTASTLAVLGLTTLSIGVANAGATRTGHTGYHSQSHSFSRNHGTNHTNFNRSTNTTRSGNGVTRTKNTTFSGNNGNTATRDISTSINVSDGAKEITRSRAITKQDQDGATMASHKNNINVNSAQSTVERSAQTVVIDDNHESIHHDVSITARGKSNGIDSFDRSVDSERNSFGTPVNEHKADVHITSDSITHSGLALGNAADGVTSINHYGNTSVRTESDGSTYINHAATSVKSFQEEPVKTHEVDKSIVINH